MTRLVLVRHGHVEGIDPRRFRGRTDIPLTPEGLRQARAAAAYIASRWRPAILYTSPLKRCIDTGREIARACACESAELGDLIDLDYGLWQWRTHREVQAERPDFFKLWLSAPQLVRFPGGESLQDLIARTANVIRMVLERHVADTVVLVGHESGVRALLLQLLDQPLSAFWRLDHEPAAVSEAEVLPDRTRVIRINETQHLAQSDQS